MKSICFSWITPFQKQCWVTLGVSLNMAQIGLVLGVAGVLLPQLRQPGSPIQIDDNSGSWIASIPAIALMIGNVTMPTIMGNYGRKLANIVTLVLFIISWTGVALSKSLAFLLVSRAVQGVATGMISTLGPILIGEYTSPKKRGAFLASISLLIGLGVLFVHTLGSYFDWQIASYSVVGLTTFNLIVVLLSPESPSWLSHQGRFDECRKTFRWLRGTTEDEELEKMIASSTALQNAKKDKNVEDLKTKVKNKMRHYAQTIKKNDFYKPFLIVIHVYAMSHWSGVNLIASYAVDFIESVVGEGTNIPLTMVSLNLTRIIGNVTALFVTHKVKRRKLLFFALGTNTGLMFAIALYKYLKIHHIAPYGTYCDFIIGMTLIHALTFVISIGALPLGFIIAGEMIPLKYKSMVGGMCSLIFSINTFVNIKTVPSMMRSLHVYGLFIVYGVLLIYLVTVAGIMLPETKDKTLQEIEETFKGKKKVPVKHRA